MASRIVVVGGSFGGLNAAFELKRRLRREAEVSVVSRSAEFLFTPSLIWVLPGQRAPGQISFPLAPALRRRGIAFINTTVQRFDPDRNVIMTDGGEMSYDYVVIATGPKYDWDVIPGMADGPAATWAVCDMNHSLRAARGWIDLLQDPGPVVAGATQAASHFVPDYEIVLNMDRSLRRAKIRDRTPLTFVTPEPFLGHFGIGGVGRSRHAVEKMFRRQGISYFTSAVTDRVDPGLLHLSDGRELRFKYAILSPPYRGVDAIRNSPGLADEYGFIPVDDRYRHERWPRVYAAGVTVQVQPREQGTVPTHVPRTGWMSEIMAKTVAANIEAELRGSDHVRKPFDTIDIRYLLDGGDRGLIVLGDRMFPPRRREMVIAGPWAHWAKIAFEKYYMTKMKRGLSRLP